MQTTSLRRPRASALQRRESEIRRQLREKRQERRIRQMERDLDRLEDQPVDIVPLRMGAHSQVDPALVEAAELRDQVVAAIRRSGYTFEEIHRRGGPVPQTLSKWQAKEVQRPHMVTMIKALNAMGMSLRLAM